MSVQGTNQVAQEAPAQAVEGQVEQPAVEAKEDLMSPKFAALAKKEKWLREQAKKVSEEKKSMEQMLKAKEEEINNNWKKRLQTNAFDVLEENGQTYDKLTEALLAKGDPVTQTIMELRREIEELKGSQHKVTEQITEREKQQYEQAKKQIRADVEALVISNEEFETLKADEAYDTVVELIEETYNETGRIMDVAEACKEVEDYLVDHYLKFTNLKKIQAKLKPAVAETDANQVQTKKQNNPVQKQQQTISNAMVPSVSKKLTEAERRERAIMAFQGKLA